MRSIFLTGLVALLMVSCEKKSDNIGECYILDSFVEENYRHDAKQLYYHEIYSDSTHANYYDPVIDQEEVDEVLKIIQAVYDSHSPQRDLVFNEYQIHSFYCYSLHGLSLKVDTNLPYIKNLADSKFPTGNRAFDELLNTYAFDSVKTSYSYPDFPWLTIYTDKEFNMIPVLEEFRQFGGIYYADFNTFCIGDGNNITLDRSDQAAVITFSIGSGDCPAGCIYHKYWEFRVTNGAARFIRTYVTGS